MLRNAPAATKEAVAVLCNHEGQPVAFILRGIQHLVSSKPVRWYARRSWWIDFDSANRDGATALETEVWRLRASCEGNSGFFEIEHLQPEDTWRLLRVIEE